MANPWEEYAAPATTDLANGPWSEYAQTTPTQGASNAELSGQPNLNSSPGSTSRGTASEIWDKVKPYITSGDPIADLKHGAGLAARALIQGGTGTSGMVADLPFQIANLFGANKQLPSQAQSQMLDQALGVPRDLGEKALLFGGSMAAGGMDPAMQAAQAALQASRGLYTQPVQLTGPGLNAQTINNGMDAGLKVTPSTSPGVGVGSKVLEAIGGKSPLTNAMQNSNRKVIDSLGNRIVGNPAGAAIDDATLNSAIGNTYAQGYDPIRAIPRLTTGGVYRNALDQISNQSPELADLVNNYRTPAMSGATAIDWIKTLRRQASDMFSSNAPNKGMIGNAYQGIADALEHNTGLNLPAGSDLLQNYQAARTQIAQQYAVKKAIVDGTGSINAANIGNQLAAGSRNGGVSPFTGDLAMLGNLAKAAPAVTKFPTGTSSTFNPVDIGLLTAAAGTLFKGEPGMAAAMAAGGLGRPAIRAMLMSPAYQNMFLRPSLAPSALSQAMQNPNVQNAVPAFIQNSGLFGQQQK